MNEPKPQAPGGPLAHTACETCVFKVIDFKDEPCRSCVYGNRGGQKDNHVRTNA